MLLLVQAYLSREVKTCVHSFQNILIFLSSLNPEKSAVKTRQATKGAMKTPAMVPTVKSSRGHSSSPGPFCLTLERRSSIRTAGTTLLLKLGPSLLPSLSQSFSAFSS